MDEYTMGKIAAHAYWQEMNDLMEGYEQIKEGFDYTKKVTTVPPAKLIKGVEKGVAQGGKLVEQAAPAVQALRKRVMGG